MADEERFEVKNEHVLEALDMVIWDGEQPDTDGDK